MLNVSQKINDFNFSGVNENGEIKTQINFKKNQYNILFLIPKAGTSICNSEVFQLKAIYDKFSNVNIIVGSLNSPEELAKWKSDNELPFSFVTVSKKWAETNNFYDPEFKLTFRVTLILDQDNILWSKTINAVKLPRSVKEILRLSESIKRINDGKTELCSV